MPFDLNQVLRIKGMVDAVMREAPSDPLTASPALVQTYLGTREICLQLVAETEAAAEFATLFPIVQPLDAFSMQRVDALVLSAKGDEARLLLAKLSGWLGSWPSAEQLVDELVRAIESAEVETNDSVEKARLRALKEGLLGAGRQIALSVVTTYLDRRV